MDFLKGVTSITISYLDLQDLLAKTTNNPIAEAEVPSMLKEAISKEIKVKITDHEGNDSCQLVLDGDDFKFSPL